MKKVNQTELLDIKIAEIKNQQHNELIDLKNQYHQVLNSITPINIIQQSFSNFTGESRTKQNLISIGSSLLMGIISKNIFGSNDNKIASIATNAFNFIVSKFKKK